MRLIDLDEFFKQNCIDRMEGKSCDECKHHVLEVSCERLMKQPTIDPVVRCKDCRYFAIVNQPYDQTWCGVMQDSVKPDGYCYWGERRDDEGD